MIPRVIHYCWFGGKPLPKLAQKCLTSWRKFCPDYEIVRWDESNFDVNCCDYVKEAYEAKKWAFVSDYARLKALAEYGGIYLDTDMEVIRPLDIFLNDLAFAGFECDEYISCGIMGCEKNFTPFAEILESYHDRHFSADGSQDITTIVKTVTRYFSRYGFVPNGIKQTVKGYTIYPIDYFYPKDYKTQKITLTPNTYTIHHFAASWLPAYVRAKSLLKRILGYRITITIIAIKKFIREKLLHQSPTGK